MMADAIVFDADSARVVNELRKVSRAQRDLEKAIKKTDESASQGSKRAQANLQRQFRESARLLNKKEELRRKLKEMTVAQKEATGPSALAGIAKVAAGYVSIGTAISTATRALRELERMRREAAERALGAEFDVAKLAQLAQGDPKKFQQLFGASQQLVKMGGAAGLGEAARTVFALESAGKLKEGLPVAAKLRGIADVPTLIDAAAALQAAIGEKETGNLRAVLSKAFAASAFAPSQVSNLLQASARAGKVGKFLQLSDEEIQASVSTIAKVGGAELAATESKQLFKSLAQLQGATIAKRIEQETERKKDKETGEEVVTVSPAGRFLQTLGPQGFKGRSIEEILDRFEKANLTFDQIQAVLGGRLEAVGGLTTLLNKRELLRSSLTEIRAAEKEGRVSKIADVLETVDITKATGEARRAEEQLKAAQQGRFATPELQRRTALAEAQTKLIEQGATSVQLIAGQAAGGTAKFFGAGPEGVGGATEAGAELATGGAILDTLGEAALQTVAPVTGILQTIKRSIDVGNAEVRRRRQLRPNAQN